MLVVDDPPGADQGAQHRQPGREHQQVLLQERDRPGRLPRAVGDRRRADPDPQRRRPLDRVPQSAEHRLRQRGDRIASDRGDRPADGLADDADRVDPAAEDRRRRRRRDQGSCAEVVPNAARSSAYRRQRLKLRHQKSLHGT